MSLYAHSNILDLSSSSLLSSSTSSLLLLLPSLLPQPSALACSIGRDGSGGAAWYTKCRSNESRNDANGSWRTSRRHFAWRVWAAKNRHDDNAATTIAADDGAADDDEPTRIAAVRTDDDERLDYRR